MELYGFSSFVQRPQFGELKLKSTFEWHYYILHSSCIQQGLEENFFALLLCLLNFQPWDSNWNRFLQPRFSREFQSILRSDVRSFERIILKLQGLNAATMLSSSEFWPRKKSSGTLDFFDMAFDPNLSICANNRYVHLYKHSYPLFCCVAFRATLSKRQKPKCEKEQSERPGIQSSWLNHCSDPHRHY